MNFLGHLRRAWIELTDAAGSFEAALNRGAAELRAGERDELNAAALCLASAMKYLRPLLETYETAGTNDNGESELELAEEGLAAFRRFRFCAGELRRRVGIEPPPTEAASLDGTEAALEDSVRALRELEGKG